MEKKVITDMYEVEKNLECVELRENGCIVVPNTLEELRIGCLINKKEYPGHCDFDILVTGADGRDGAYGSGEDGTIGEAGGNVKIMVSDLVGDIHIKASGGNGGRGGKGIEGADGGRGGNGGDGGDGAKVDFTYERKDPESTSYAYVYSFRGGSGGKGGSGGTSTGGYGIGGECGQKGTAGGKFGDGGNGGLQGKDAVVTIHHPDGGCTINDEEVYEESQDNLRTGAHTLNFADDRDFRIFIQKHGGEKKLKKFPHIWDAALKTRKKAQSINANECDAQEVRIYGNITQVERVGVSGVSDCKTNELVKEDGNTVYNFYQMYADVSLSYANSSTNIIHYPDGHNLPVPAAYQVSVRIKDEDTKEVIYNNSIYGEGDVMRTLNKIKTDIFPAEKLNGRRFKLSADVTYENHDGSITYAELAGNVVSFDNTEQESYIDKIEITNPHWQHSKKAGDIIFLYGRTLSSSQAYSAADYYDEDGYYFKNQFDKGLLRTIIPITGKIAFHNTEKKVLNAAIDSYQDGEGKYSPFYLDYNISRGRSCVASFHNNTRLEDLGGILNEQGDIEFDSAANSASFDMKYPNDSSISPYDWDCNISGGFLDDSSHKCYLNGGFVLNVEHEPRVGRKNDRYYISVISADEVPKGSEYYVSTEGKLNVYIPPIVIYWGCYAKETLIRTGERILKRADEIRIGDKLWVFGDKNLVVKDVLKGMDPTIFKIITADGNNIRVSGGHAMKVFDGKNWNGERASARTLKPGDILMTPYGTTEITEVHEEPYKDYVYNFIFDDENCAHYLEANGYWSGDFFAQNEVPKVKPDPIREEVNALIEEIKQLTKEQIKK
ncbi:Uncharacterised protein [uncultured Roseburia sp.]|uniref:Hint domain-containing protein n=1 Tax=Brotonthovivens ammoniilytica TaxID=2981725 RepID=A0ABT2THL0_9FIRM|nr:Hint domain-containing protein [Brotonthovivens ammoniilytica]MCU6761191.1 Hint domain-containing protein [Brotonthovivens ammoniilytica]SCI21501.1 Uncharacterised protein [uncultured Roseburia sp.]